MPGKGQSAVDSIVSYHLQHTGVSRFAKIRYIYKQVLKRKLTEQEFSRLCREFADYVFEEVVRAPYIKGAEEFLRNYKKHYLYFVVTATPQAEIEQIIRRRNMSGYFTAVYGAPRKKADSVGLILRGYNLASEDAVYIGDSMSDYEAASHNSLHFIAKAGLDNGGDIFKAIRNCLKIEDLTGLNQIINRVSGVGV